MPDKSAKANVTVFNPIFITTSRLRVYERSNGTFYVKDAQGRRVNVTRLPKSEHFIIDVPDRRVDLEKR